MHARVGQALKKMNERDGARACAEYDTLAGPESCVSDLSHI